MRFPNIFDQPLSNACLTDLDPLPIVNLKDGAEPKQCKVQRIDKSEKKFSDGKIEELLRVGVINKSNSSWRHQPLVVPKDNGSGKRLVINSKPLNEITEFDAFPLLNVISNLSYPRIFPKQLFPIMVTSMNTPGALSVKYIEMKMWHIFMPLGTNGLKNAVAYCFRTRQKVLEGCRGVAVYLDDLCVYGSTREEHENNLEAVLSAIKKYGLLKGTAS